MNKKAISQIYKFAMIVGFVLFGMGILVSTYGWLSLGAGKQIKTTYVNLNLTGALSIYALVTGLFCIAVGILGYFTGRFKSAMFACPFMFFSLLIGIMMMIVAALSGGNKSATIALMSSLCNTNLQFIKSTDNITKFYSANMTIQWTYDTFIDNVMCTAACPCDLSAQEVWQNPNSDFYLEWSSYTQSKGIKNVYVNPSNSSTKTYKTFSDCYDNYLSTNPQFSQKYSQSSFFSNGGYEFIKMLEQKYSCGGFCYTPWYFLTIPVNQGPVDYKQECTQSMIQEVNGSNGVTACASIASIILLLAFIATVPLCCGINEQIILNK